MSFKSQKQIWEHLISGGMVKHYSHGDTGFNYLNASGFVVNFRGAEVAESFVAPEDWSIYEEPKKKKKITLYRYTYKERSGHIFCSAWRSGEPQNMGTVVLVEAREIEVDE